MSTKNVMVFLEQHKKKIANVSIELICEANRLAATLGGEVEAILIGNGIKEEMSIPAHYGCKKIFYAEDKRLSHFTSIPYAKIIADIIREQKPQIVLFGATTMGRDVAPRVASELKCGLTADCTELKIGDHTIKDKEFKNILLQIRPAFGGNIIATIVSPESFPSMATVRPGVMKLEEANTKLKAQIVPFTHKLKDSDFMTEILEVIDEAKAVNLQAAQIIVSAGMGASDTSALALVKDLAKTLGGEVGSSRPVVDSGVLIKDHQVGQTGVTVRPNLYIACGISGQIQHRAGMAESKRIIAINKDPEAPIFSIAHYGIVGDVNDVIPKMIKAFKAKA